MSYIGTEPKDIRSFGRTKFDYTATQGQTAFTGADDDGKVLAFTVGQIEVYVNGILMDDSDFTTTGTGTVTLASAANLNDVINIVSFETNIPDSNYVPASGGTFSGNVTLGGTLGVTGATTMSGDLTISTTAGQLKLTDTDGTEQNTTIKQSGGNLFIQARDNTNNAGIVFAGNGGGNFDEHMRINSSGKVGIGTNNPAKILDITESTAADTGQVKLTYAGGDGNRAGFILNNTHTGGREYGIYAGNNSTGGGLGNSLGISDNTASTAYRLLIDSSGRVTTPSQPSFSVRSNGGNSGNTWTQDTVIKFQTVQHNVGSHYSTSTGRFTAPVNGFYVFHYAGFGYNGGQIAAGNTTGVALRTNGTNFVMFVYDYSNSSNGYPSSTGTVGLYLTASDYVDVYTTSQGQYADSSNLYTHWSGYLLH